MPDRGMAPDHHVALDDRRVGNERGRIDGGARGRLLLQREV